MSDEEMANLARNWDALCLYAWRSHMYNPQLENWLHRIQVPTLVLWGASDRIVTPDYGRAYSSLTPGAEFAVIDKAGHHPELEQPRAFVDRVERSRGLPSSARKKNCPRPLYCEPVHSKNTRMLPYWQHRRSRT
jgi:pimeloyl-ACP methyl ester carboxylesterase